MASSHDADTEGITRRKSLSALAGAGALALAGCTQSTGGGSGDALSGSINIAGFDRLPADERDRGGLRRGARPGLGRHQFDRLGRRVLELLLRRRHRLQQREPADPARRRNSARRTASSTSSSSRRRTRSRSSSTPRPTGSTPSPSRSSHRSGRTPAQTWDEVRDEFPNEEIERFGAADTSGTYDYFIESILEERGHTSDYQATEQDNSIAQGVSGSEYAIGYFGFAYYFQNPDQLKALGIDDGNGPVEPSLETASSGEYTPLSRPLFTYPSIESLGKEHVAEFARYFVEQTTNEDLVAGDVGYVPATEETQEEQMEILEDAIERAQE